MKGRVRLRYRLIPDPAGYRLAKPDFLFRDPVRVLTNCNFVGWTSLRSHVACYMGLCSKWSSNDHTLAIISEEPIREPCQTIQRLSLHWDMLFSEDMLSYDHTFRGCSFASDSEKGNHTDQNLPGLSTNVQSLRSVRAQIMSQDHFSHEETNAIETEMGPVHMKCCGDSITSIKRTLFKRK